MSASNRRRGFVWTDESETHVCHQLWTCLFEAVCHLRNTELLVQQKYISDGSKKQAALSDRSLLSAGSFYLLTPETSFTRLPVAALMVTIRI